MAIQDEIAGLRRLMESVNKATTSANGSLGKIATEQQDLRQQITTVKQVADRALQMCNDLAIRVADLEKR
jgi:hypothetical protein